jgi:outer membrane protein assembly complex protein YaeT
MERTAFGNRRTAQSVRLITVVLFTVIMVACQGTTVHQPGPAPGSQAPGAQILFEGLKAISEATIREALKHDIDDANAHGFRKADVDDLAFEVERFYRSSGYHFVRADYAFSDEGATIRVEEGALVGIGELTFDGNRSIATGDLTEVLTARRTLLGLGRLIFVESEVVALGQAVAEIYFERGYLEVEVDRPEVTFNDDRTTANVLVRIREGRQHIFTGFDFFELDAIEPETLEERFAYLEDSVFVPRLVLEVRTAVEEAFAETGYPDAHATVTDSVTDSVTEQGEPRADHALRVRADPGPRVRVREIVVSGNEETKSTFIKERVLLAEGAPFNGRLLRESFRKLYGSGIFTSVDLQLVETAAGHAEDGAELRDLHVKVVEGSTLEYFFELGLGSYDLGRGKAGILERNLFERGLVGRVEVLGSIRGGEAILGISDPSILGSNWDLDIPVSALYREEPSFTVVEGTVGPRLAVALNDQLRAGLTYRFSLSDLRGELEVDPISGESELRLGAAGPFLQYDSRNDIFTPTHGTRARVFGELATPSLGSEIDFLRGGLVLGKYLEIFDGSVIAATAQTEWIVPIDNTEFIPIQERLFLGGENGVRSFQQSEVGRKDVRGDPLGGEVRNFVSLELRQTIWDNFGMTIFGDYGNVALDEEKPFDDFRPGVGAGLFYRLPIGPIRVDFAFNPDHKSGEDSFVVQFAVGMAY